MSLLIVRAPLKPFYGASVSSALEWQDIACAEQFEWCLVSDQEPGTESTVVLDTGVGSPESMPYADQALVLMPTLDVRLLEAKVPLANAKKLQQILPNLIEEYVLGSADTLVIQAFPPVPGQLALQRTLALIDRVWLAWLTKQLEQLVCPRVRLIPDCFLLQVKDALEFSAIPSTCFMRVDGNLIFTTRTGEQLGVAWVERAQVESQAALPSRFAQELAVEMAWDWLVPSAQVFMQKTAHSKSAHFATNLLPSSFRKQSGKRGLFSDTSLSRLLGDKAKRASAEQAVGMAWLDPAIWRRPYQWLTYLLMMLVSAYVIHLAWLLVDQWRWDKRMEYLAAQSLTPASVALITKGGANPNSEAVLGALVRQATDDLRRQGLASDVDFASMAAKLQQLKAGYGAEPIQSLDYDGYGLNFQFKAGAVGQPAAQLIERANRLGLKLRLIGPDRYRLEPYAGLAGAMDSLSNPKGNL